jgi:hypothetical protein
MSTQRQQYSAECTARVALEALKGLNTVNELASTYGVPRRRWRIGNISSKRRCPRFSRHDARNARTTQRRSQRSDTNKSGHSRWS